MGDVHIFAKIRLRFLYTVVDSLSFFFDLDKRNQRRELTHEVTCS